MKISRLLIVFLAVVLVTSTWGLTPARAQSSASVSTNVIHIKPAEARLATLRVDNRTGGTLYVRLSGQQNYYFSTSTYGKTTFQNIVPGKYTIRVSASNCSGSLTYKRNIKGKETLKPFVCKK